jgi:hypothetical protein
MLDNSERLSEVKSTESHTRIHAQHCEGDSSQPSSISSPITNISSQRHDHNLGFHAETYHDHCVVQAIILPQNDLTLSLLVGADLTLNGIDLTLPPSTSFSLHNG